MLINAKFDQKVVIRPEDRAWVPSPAGGVERCMLDRVGDEVARATSLVRFAPGADFPTHAHGGGEEFFVLEGTFSDETGDFPTGSYVRNPIGTSHKPRTDEGCTIFVKLHQFAPDDQAHFSVNTSDTPFRQGSATGLSVLPLHSYGTESCALVRWAPGTKFNPHTHWGGEEIFVLSGTFQDEHGDYPKGTWIRSPHLSQHHPFSTEGCIIYVKTGHLTEISVPATGS